MFVFDQSNVIVWKEKLKKKSKELLHAPWLWTMREQHLSNPGNWVFVKWNHHNPVLFCCNALNLAGGESKIFHWILKSWWGSSSSEGIFLNLYHSFLCWLYRGWTTSMILEPEAKRFLCVQNAEFKWQEANGFPKSVCLFKAICTSYGGRSPTGPHTPGQNDGLGLTEFWHEVSPLAIPRLSLTGRMHLPLLVVFPPG